MSEYIVTDAELTAVADAIRTKGGTQANLEWYSGFVDAIGDISGGGSGGGQGALIDPSFQGLSYIYCVRAGSSIYHYTSKRFYSQIFEVKANHRYALFIGENIGDRRRAGFFSGISMSDIQPYIDSASSSDTEIFQNGVRLAPEANNVDDSGVALRARILYTPQSNGVIVYTSDDTTNGSGNNFPAYCVDLDGTSQPTGNLRYDVGGFFGSVDGSTNTSIQCNYDAKAGTKVLLVIMHRTQITLSDDEFSIVSDVKAENFEQYIAIYEKIISSDVANASVTINNAGEGRTAACIFIIKNNVSVGTPTQQAMDLGVNTYRYTIDASNAPCLIVLNNPWAGGAIPSLTPQQNIIPLSAYTKSSTIRFSAWIYEGNISCTWAESNMSTGTDDRNYNRVFIYPLIIQ